MVRRTISLPESTEALVRRLALEGESFSAAVTRLIEVGADAVKDGKRLSHISPAARRNKELRRKVEEYIAEPVETPGGWRLIIDESRYRDAVGGDLPAPSQD